MIAKTSLRLLFLLTCSANWAHGAFTTVINAPPAAIENLRSIGSDTQLNLYPGASTDYFFQLGEYRQPSSNIEVNLFGGTIGEYFRTSSSRVENSDIVVNIYSGKVGGRFGADRGSVVNIYSGTVGKYFGAGIGSVVNIFGGAVGSFGANGVVNLAGGSVGEISISAPGQLNISGGEFRLNGMPLVGLGPVGNTLPLNLPTGGLLTGTLADGTPFAISDQGVLGDAIDDGTLTLRAAAIPAAIPATFRATGNSPPPRGLRAGQRLFISDGGVVADNFNASWGSVIDIAAGEVGENFEATGAIVNMTSGTIGELADAFMGSVVNLSGGSIGSNFTAGTGSTVNVSGGTIGILFEMESGSIVNYSGGVIQHVLHAHEGSQFNILGGEFRLNGVPVTGLSEVGAARPFSIPAGAVLSGTLADGSSFAMTGAGVFGDYLAGGTLALHAAPLPTRGPAEIQLPTDPAPLGLRTGQTLVVSEGGALPSNFTAGWGTAVNIQGGDVGHNFQATGALVNISGGNIGHGLSAHYGSVVNISGGTFLGSLSANRGSVLNISGGMFGHYLSAGSGGVVNIAGGTIAEYSYALDGSVFNISGGSVGDDFTIYAATVNVSGGLIGDGLRANPGSALNISGGVIGDDLEIRGRATLSGSEFRIDGSPISGLEMYGLPVAVDIPAGSVLSGTLADGTQFAFSGEDGDRFAAGSLHLEEWPTQPRGAATIHLPGSQRPQGIRGGQTLFVAAGGVVGDNFNADWGSVVTIEGGRVGKNFEAVGSQVLIAGGSIGAGFDAFYGSVVNVTGGYFGAESEEESAGDFTAHRGSVVNISGGSFGSKLHAAAGSEVHLIGSAFFLDGMPIAGLVPGETLEIKTREGLFDYNKLLTGILLDGSEFNFRLSSSGYDSSYSDYFDANAILTVTLVLTADLNGDNVVSPIDLARWKTSFAASAAGDSDGDLDSDGADFLAWQRQLGGHVAAAETELVPEPATLRLSMAMLLGMALQGRRRRPPTATPAPTLSFVRKFPPRKRRSRLWTLRFPQLCRSHLHYAPGC
jgi:hypothetical protein